MKIMLSQSDEAEQLAVRAASLIDRLYDAGRFDEAENLDASFEEWLDATSADIDYILTESWNLSGSQFPDTETGIEDYETGETEDDAPLPVWRFWSRSNRIDVLGRPLPDEQGEWYLSDDYWEPDMIAACASGD